MKKTVCDQGLDGRVVWEMKRGSGSRALAGSVWAGKVVSEA